MGSAESKIDFSLTPAEYEGENFSDIVKQELVKMNRQDLVDKIDSGEIKLEIDRRIAVETGNARQKTMEDPEDFDATEHMVMRAQMKAQEILADFTEKQ